MLPSFRSYPAGLFDSLRGVTKLVLHTLTGPIYVVSVSSEHVFVQILKGNVATHKYVVYFLENFPSVVLW